MCGCNMCGCAHMYFFYREGSIDGATLARGGENVGIYTQVPTCAVCARSDLCLGSLSVASVRRAHVPPAGAAHTHARPRGGTGVSDIRRAPVPKVYT